jgi:hypothetical protein
MGYTVEEKKDTVVKATLQASEKNLRDKIEEAAADREKLIKQNFDLRVEKEKSEA